MGEGKKLDVRQEAVMRTPLNCTKCGTESMILNDLRYCGGCVRSFEDCVCAPKGVVSDSQTANPHVPHYLRVPLLS